MSQAKSYDGPERIEDFFEEDSMEASDVELIDDAGYVRTHVERVYLQTMNLAKQFARRECIEYKIREKMCQLDHPYAFMYKCKQYHDDKEACENAIQEEIKQKGKIWAMYQINRFENEILDKIEQQFTTRDENKE